MLRISFIRAVCLQGTRLQYARTVRKYSDFPTGSFGDGVTNFTVSSSNSASAAAGKQSHYDLDPKHIAETLQNDPNLEHFFDSKTLHSVNEITNPKPETPDPYDLSSIPFLDVNSDSIPTSIGNHTYASAQPLNGEPQTMTTEDFIKMMARENSQSLDQLFLSDIDDSDTHLPSSDEYMAEMVSKQDLKDLGKTENAVEKPTKVVPDTPLVDFLHKDDVPSYDQIPNHIPLADIVQTDLPVLFISNLTDPRLNLSIEKYIYDHFPDPKDPINRFCKRLFLYQNTNCIVLGKNQNIFREINLRLASASGVPILRRYSGGGTVVHDLGNFNFSFMCLKNDFSRTSFTTGLIENWNEAYPDPEKQLTVNDKGDMVRQIDLKKVSGSAFQISKGKSLHHGTMLLDADLKKLGKLLKLHPTRSSNIIDKATNSIPSPVTNLNVDPDSFVNITATTFLKNFGLPTNLSKNRKINSFDNIHVLKTGNIETQVVKIDDLTKLPLEIQETYNQLKTWDWIFGKSPRFSINFGLDNESIKVKFTVDKGRIVEMEYDLKNEKDTRLNDLVNALKNSDVKVKFASFSISKYVKDEKLLKEFSWHIDQCLNYDNIGIITEEAENK